MTTDNETTPDGDVDVQTTQAASADDASFEATVRVVVPVVFGLVTVVGLVGNLLVIAVALRHKTRNTTSVLIVGLAVADLVFIVVCVPFTAVIYALPVWPFGTVFCKLYQYVIHVTAHASVYTLVLMSLDRYLAVVHPIRSLTVRTRRNAAVALVILWTVVVAANSPMLQHFSVYRYGDTDTQVRSTCLNHRIVNDHRYGRVFYGTFFAFGFVLPMTLICALYARMLVRLLRGRGAGVGGSSGGHHRNMRRGTSTESARARRRVTRLVVVVVAVFGACWLPIHVVFIVQYFDESAAAAGDDDQADVITHALVAVRLAANCLAYANSCLNPILYAFLSDNFRSGLVRLCRRGGGQHRGTVAELTRRQREVTAGQRRVGRGDGVPDRC